jgi:hypothetical protein
MPRPVRVVTLIDLIGPIGGAEHLAMQLATRLDRDRFAPSVCVSRLDTGEPEPGPMADAVEEMRRDGIPVFGLGRTSSRDLRPWRRLGAHLRGGADVLHSHKFGSNLWGALVGSLAATPSSSPTSTAGRSRASRCASCSTATSSAASPTRSSPSRARTAAA